MVYLGVALIESHIMNDNPVSILSSCMGHAIHVGFSEIKYKQKDWAASQSQGEDVFADVTRGHEEWEVEVVAMFPQTWGSTALGFGGIGGASMTTAYTVILSSHQTGEYLVYFGGRFAYKINKPNESFTEDMRTANMDDVSSHGKYERMQPRGENV